MYRKETKPVRVGNIWIGGDHPVTVQSMLSVPSWDIEGNVRQAKALADAGCEIIRTAVPNKEAIALIPALKEAVSVPIVADIHFDYRLAIESVHAGVDKVRINPGNIGDDGRVKQVVDACRSAGVPIRIGVNSGSLEKDILAKYNGITPEGLTESALRHVRLLEKYDFDDIVISIKSSSVPLMRDAYLKMSEICRYPLHLGVTEAGTPRMGTIKSAAGIGSLLLDGIGDTIRVSLTSDPVEEVKAGFDILRAVGVRKKGITFVSCPTCGRTRIDLFSLSQKVEEALSGIDADIKIAVMGCIVNGPGEASDADLGVAGGDGCGLIFRKGKILRKVPEDQIVSELVAETKKYLSEQNK